MCIYEGYYPKSCEAGYPVSTTSGQDSVCSSTTQTALILCVTANDSMSHYAVDSSSERRRARSGDCE